MTFKSNLLRYAAVVSSVLLLGAYLFHQGGCASQSEPTTQHAPSPATVPVTAPAVTAEDVTPAISPAEVEDEPLLPSSKSAPTFKSKATTTKPIKATIMPGSKSAAVFREEDVSDSNTTPSQQGAPNAPAK